MKKLSVFDVIAIGGAVVKSVRRIRDEIEAAKDPDTPGGAKVTPGEGVLAVLRGLVDATPAVYQRVAGEPLPEDFDLIEALAEL